MIAILQFTDEQRPGFLQTYLNQRDLSYHIYRIDKGDHLPELTAISALALMGGTMEANAPLPWIEEVLALIRQADLHAIPVIGHCLGGQLIARALGAEVKNNPCFEIGWHEVDVLASASQMMCFEDDEVFIPFHWHYQTFELPVDAELFMTNQNCTRQAFQLRHNLAFQCHIEITEALVLLWCESEAAQLAQLSGSVTVQTQQQMLENISDRVSALHSLTIRIYDYWLSLSV